MLFDVTEVGSDLADPTAQVISVEPSAAIVTVVVAAAASLNVTPAEGLALHA